MTTRKQLTAWLSKLPANAQIAVDDGGLTLVVVDGEQLVNGHHETGGAYIEIGGICRADPVEPVCPALSEDPLLDA